jgi:hypothetical protein
LSFEQGLWLGIVCGTLTKLVLLMWITLRIDWAKEVRVSDSVLSLLWKENVIYSFILYYDLQATKSKERVFSQILPVS